jgi:hypothetical protein
MKGTIDWFGKEIGAVIGTSKYGRVRESQSREMGWFSINNSKLLIIYLQWNQ